MHNAGGRSEVAIGVQVASFVLDRGFSEFYRSSTVSLYCRTLVAVSTSVQIRESGALDFSSRASGMYAGRTAQLALPFYE